MDLFTLLEVRAVRIKPEKVLLALAIILVVFVYYAALMEYPPRITGIPQGTSPYSPGPLGTLVLANHISNLYKVRMLHDLGELGQVKAERCVYTIISPDTPYSLREVNHIVTKLSALCGDVSYLVADETTNSNPLLIALNSSMRITGLIIVEKHAENATQLFSFYPIARIKIGEREHVVQLDKASTVIGGFPIGYAYPSNFSALQLLDQSSGDMKSVEAPAVASIQYLNNSTILVLSDGSIFTNQVLSSGQEAYINLIDDLFAYLCRGVGDCLVLIDASHYVSGSPAGFLDTASILLSKEDYVGSLYSLVAYVLLSIHPLRVISPALLRALSLSEAIEHPFTVTVFAVLVSALCVLVVKEKTGITGDTRFLDEESGWKQASSIVYKHRGGFSRHDFIDAVRSANTILKRILGVDMLVEDPCTILALGEKQGECKNLHARILTYWDRATLRRRTPIFVSWSNAINDLFDFYELLTGTKWNEQ